MVYTRLLVPLDGSQLAEAALPYAKALARGLHARIELLRVVEPPSSEAGDSAHGIYPHRPADSVMSNARDYLEGIARNLREDGLSAFSKIREGRPADGIAAEAELEPDTLITMSSHGRSGVTRWLLGSVTDRVLHTASSPLLVIRAGTKGSKSAELEVANLLVLLDGSDLADQVFPHVAALATALKTKVHLVRANSSLGEYHAYMDDYSLDSSATIYTGMYEEFSKEADAQAMEYLHDGRDWLRKMGVHSVEENLLKGHAAEVIVDLAQEMPRCMIVMSSHGRSGIGRWLLGSVADRVVRYAGVPVLIVRAAAAREEKAGGPDPRE